MWCLITTCICIYKYRVPAFRRFDILGIYDNRLFDLSDTPVALQTPQPLKGSLDISAAKPLHQGFKFRLSCLRSFADTYHSKEKQLSINSER